MVGHRRQLRRTLGLLVLSLSLSLHQQAALAADSSASPAALPVPSSPLTAAISSAQPGPSMTLLDRIGRFISNVFSIDEGLGMDGDGGLFGGDGTSIAWGGSTLEVVKTQATYLTRAAAFGPHITSDEGLKGGLLSISDFYHPTEQSSRSSISVENHGCPYRGGPGWRDEDYDDDGNKVFYPDQPALYPAHAKPPANWIALVERGGNCSFASKVRVAQALGATAVVVGDAPSPGYDDGRKPPGEESDPGLSGRLLTMYAPGDTSDVKIPSTFITRPSYVDLIRLIDEIEKEGEERCLLRKKEGKECENSREMGLEVILGRDDIMWEWPLIDLAFILLLLPSFMTLTTIIVHRIRLSRQRRKERAPELVVLGLPCLIWRPDGQPWEKVEGSEAGATTGEGQQKAANIKDGSAPSDDMELGATQTDDEQAGPSSAPLKTVPVLPPAPVRQHAYLPPGRTYYSCDECAICLSEFVDGDRVRVLPCGHVFHLAEIDSWLLRVKKLCPICKRDITVPVPPTLPTPTLHSSSTATASPADDGSGEDGDQDASESAPLLARQ